MRPPVFVRTLTPEERSALEAGLRSSAAFGLRRCQILLASARGERPPRIARQLGCHDQTVRAASAAFNTRGLAALRRGSSVAHTLHRAFDEAPGARLAALLQRSPRDFDLPTSLCTLDLLAQVSVREGLTSTRVRGVLSVASSSRTWSTP